MPRAKTKQISIVLAGSGDQLHEVEIQSGVTVRDLVDRLNLSGHLSKYGDPATSMAKVTARTTKRPPRKMGSSTC